MPDPNIHSLLDYIPFVSLVVGNKDIPTPLVTRLAETVVMSLDVC